MAVVQAQVTLGATPATPVALGAAVAADCVVNVYCVNPEATSETATVEVRLQDAAQTGEQVIVPAATVLANNRLVEGPIYLASGDRVYVYGSNTNQVFQMLGQTL